MTDEPEGIRQSVRTPRAAAVAGIIFAVLLITSEVMVWRYVPSVASAQAGEIVRHSKELTLAMNLRPFSGIAFLWFMGVVRNRLGSLEDRFFATVFLGSGLLYVAMMFTGGALDKARFLVGSAGRTVRLWRRTCSTCTSVIIGCKPPTWEGSIKRMELAPTKGACQWH
jgi:hypothetical protein